MKRGAVVHTTCRLTAGVGGQAEFRGFFHESQRCGRGGGVKPPAPGSFGGGDCGGSQRGKSGCCHIIIVAIQIDRGVAFAGGAVVPGFGRCRGATGAGGSLAAGCPDGDRSGRSIAGSIVGAGAGALIKFISCRRCATVIIPSNLRRGTGVTPYPHPINTSGKRGENRGSRKIGTDTDSVVTGEKCTCSGRGFVQLAIDIT